MEISRKYQPRRNLRVGNFALLLLSFIQMSSVQAFSISNSRQTMINPTRFDSSSTRNHLIQSSMISSFRLRNSSLRLMSTDENNTSVKSTTDPGIPTIVIEEGESSKEIYEQAIKRTSLWILASVVFGIGLNFAVSPEISQEFFAGWLLEQSLSIDNVLVFLLLFDYFKVPLANQDRVLNFGIYGAIVMRATMIGLGSVALQEFHAVLLVFAGILIYSSATVLLGGDDEEEGEEEDMSKNQLVQISKSLFDASDKFDGDRFFTIIDGVKKATPLFICMVAVELSDVVFAVDSIPAVFGVTDVSFPNTFAIFSMHFFRTLTEIHASLESISGIHIKYVCYYGTPKSIYNSFKSGVGFRILGASCCSSTRFCRGQACGRIFRFPNFNSIISCSCCYNAEWWGRPFPLGEGSQSNRRTECLRNNFTKLKLLTTN